KAEALARWKSITSSGMDDPRVFLNGNRAQFYFPDNQTNSTPVSPAAARGWLVYRAHWETDRVQSEGYECALARLGSSSSRRLQVENPDWREATVISGEPANRFMKDLLEKLTPQARGHGVCYEAFFADRILFRDAEGMARLAAQKD